MGEEGAEAGKAGGCLVAGPWASSRWDDQQLDKQDLLLRIRLKLSFLGERIRDPNIRTQKFPDPNTNIRIRTQSIRIRAQNIRIH